jgi:hypothetical protein
MTYPSEEEIEAADIVQLCTWTRFLPSPGQNAIGAEDFQESMKRETRLLVHIMARQIHLGGMTPAISKRIGWGN